MESRETAHERRLRDTRERHRREILALHLRAAAEVLGEAAEATERGEAFDEDLTHHRVITLMSMGMPSPRSG